ncbi:FecCD family ABC transporter permease [Marinobacter xestospongiae]|uniref:FecCD family ABC transporter permease n=1 Tax=Marinobacter xestospongiae TaxID=994319 RepID=UPI0020031946|nr:iron ABC transporter permease [Marinobacter xestospongiae]MCK7566749.1 iron ABC transporter permease [Marinobacter xestospongiae]
MSNSAPNALPYQGPSDCWHLRVGRWSVLLHRRAWLVTLAMTVLLVLASLVALSIGSAQLTIADAWHTLLGQGNRLQEVMVFKIRLPRLLAVIVAGAALGLSGCLIQTLVRNRLATPDMVGVNEGATLAIVLFSLYLTAGSWPWWASPLGASLAVAALYTLCRNPGEQGYLFVVIGIALTELFQALGDFLMSTQSLVHLNSLYLWTMGHFAGQGYSVLAPVALCLLALCPLLAWLVRPLSALPFGTATAQGLGVNVNRLQLLILTLAILVAALGTAIGGPVIFIAMAAPILASKLVRNGPVPVWIAALAGALLLVLSDTLVRVLAQPTEVPTGIMTRFLGGILLLFLLIQDRRRVD